MASEAYRDNTLQAQLDNDFVYGSLLTEVEALARMSAKYEVGVRRLLIKRNEESCRDIEDQLKDPNFVPNTDSDDSDDSEEYSSVNKISVEHPQEGKKKTICPTKDKSEVTGKQHNPAVTVSHSIGRKRSSTPWHSQNPDSELYPSDNLKAKRTSPTPKRSHHAIYECPVCHKPERKLETSPIQSR